MSLIRSDTRRGTCDVKHKLHIRIVEKISHRTVGDLAGALDGGSLGQLKLYGKVTLIFLRHKTRRHKVIHHIDKH